MVDQPHYYVCRACGLHRVERIPTCPCVESGVCEECHENDRAPIVKIEAPGDPAASTPVA